MNRIKGFLLSFSLLLLLMSGCNPANSTQPSGNKNDANSEDPTSYPYRIVTSCGMVTDIVRVVAGDRAEVVGLMNSTVDPHMHQPAREDNDQLMKADIVFFSGLMLEGQMGDTLIRVGRQGKPVYAVTEEIDRKYLRQPSEFEGHWDPHVWMDVKAWSECVNAVSKALAEFDPKHASEYQTRAKDYREKLTQLDNYVRKVIATIPEGSRWLITAHDAFGYFSRAYNIPVRSVQGLTTESEPAVADVNNLVEFIATKQVPAIFVESTVNPQSIQAIVEGVKSRDWNVSIGGALFSDAMGKEGTYEGTYVGMLDHNATLIARSLGGEAPKDGFQGKLTLVEEFEKEATNK